VKVLVVVLGLMASVAAAVAQEATPSAAGPGLSRGDPVPLGQMVQAGPVELQVHEVLVGPEAVDAVLAASPTNVGPREGSTYIAVNVAARNTGQQSLWLDNDDFALTGDSGLVRRFLGVKAPEPSLDAVLEPGALATGWVAFAAPSDEGSLLLLFDSLELNGSWADRVLALQEGVAIPDLAQPAATANSVGTDAASAVGVGETAVTADWSVTLLDVVAGAPAFDLVDYRTGALGAGDAAGEDGSIWVALRFRVQNARAGGGVAHFPANAFVLVDEAGNPLLDVVTLTPPRPDAAGDYYPGAVQEGWVMFDVPLDYTASMVRLLPYAHTAISLDPRYFRFG
jgi:hypothetical protein